MLPLEVYTHICNVLDVDINQAFRVAYGQEVIYFPYGVDENQILYELENIADENLHGGASYGILKLLLVSIFIVATVGQYDLNRQQCYDIYRDGDYPSELRFHKYIAEQKNAEIDYGKDSEIAKVLKEKNNQYKWCYKNFQAKDSDQTKNNFLADLASYVLSFNSAGILVGALATVVTSLLGVETVRYLFRQMTRTNTVSAPLRIDDRAPQALIYQPLQYVPPSASSKQTPASRKRLPSATPKPSPSATPKRSPSATPKRSPSPSASKRRSRGGFAGGEVELLLQQISVALKENADKLSGGARCSYIATTTVAFGVLAAIFGLIVFAQTHVLSTKYSQKMFVKAEQYVNELITAMFGEYKLEDASFFAQVLRGVGNVIKQIFKSIEKIVSGAITLSFADFVSQLTGAASKIPAWIGPSLISGLSIAVQTILGAFYYVLTKPFNLLWTFSSDLCDQIAQGKFLVNEDDGVKITYAIDELVKAAPKTRSTISTTNKKEVILEKHKANQVVHKIENIIQEPVRKRVRRLAKSPSKPSRKRKRTSPKKA